MLLIYKMHKHIPNGIRAFGGNVERMRTHEPYNQAAFLCSPYCCNRVDVNQRLSYLDEWLIIHFFPHCFAAFSAICERLRGPGLRRWIPARKILCASSFGLRGRVFERSGMMPQVSQGRI